ncbi:hypothetical protein MHM88_22220, partial [Epibacterium sp. MM17-32]|uniref:beta strand repeat-containing protein n=1 Tax=Epibacterium sp. MM17-32 TaxID=2917734 RepID=UPI001EF5E0E1
ALATSGEAGSVDNSGDVTVSGGTVADLDNLSGGAVTVSGGTVADLDNDGEATLSGGTVTQVRNTGSATLTVSGGNVDEVVNSATMSMSDGSVTELSNSGGSASISDGTVGSIDNNGGATLVVGADASVSSVANTGSSTVTSAGTIGSLTTSGSGVITNTGNITGTVGLTGSSQLDNDGGVIGGDVTVVGSGTLTNSGTIQGTISGAGANTITNSGVVVGAVTVSSDTTFTTSGTAGTVTNHGTTNVTDGDVSDLENGTDGTLEIASGATVATVTNAGSGTSAGAIGSLINTGGSFTTSGDVTGTTTVSGGSVTNDGGSLQGDVTVADGATLVTSGTAGMVSNAGSTSVTGGSVDDLDNGTSGTVSVSAGASVASLSNAGTGSSAGEVGTLTQTTGSFTNTGDVTGTTTITGGTVSNDGGDLQGAVSVAAGATLETSGSADEVTSAGTVAINGGTVAELTNSGAVTIAAAGTLGALTTSAGSVDNSGAISGDVAITGGTVTSSGSIGGAVTLSGGSLETSGSIGGALTNTASLVSTGSIGGDLVNQGSATASLSGSLSGTLSTADSAAVTISGDLSGLAGITHDSSEDFVVEGGTTVLAADASVANAGTFVISGASLNGSGTGSFVNAGSASLSVGSGGGLGLDLSNAGSVDVVAGGTVTGTITNASGATLDLDGSVGGDVSNAGVMALAGDISGGLSNTGTLTVDGTAEVGGQFSNTGTLTVSGSLAHGVFNNTGSDSAGGAPIWSAEMAVSDAVLQVASGGALTSGTLNNASTLGLNDGASVTSAVVNSGTIFADGSVTGAGSLTHETGAIIDLADGDSDDVFTVTGDAVLNGTFEVDIVLEGEELTGDQIAVAGAVSGHATFNLNLSDDDPNDLLGSVDVLTYGSGALDSVTVNGLPNSGAAVFALVNNTDTGSYQLQSGANPAIGGLATGLALTQSLIGSVVNRPTSPFVTGLAVPGEEPCGFGTWSRATGGTATASGSSETALGTYESELSADYHGLQIGADYSCFGGAFNGWDLSFGGIMGYNGGSTNQPVYFFDASTGEVNTDILTSTNRTSFTQTYGSAYIAASRSFADSGRVLFADLQVRTDKTGFDLDNTVNGAALDTVRTLSDDPTLTLEDLSFGVRDQSYDSTGVTIGGSAGLSIPINEAKDLRIVPTLGFSLANIETDTLFFDNGELEIEEIESRVGFAGLTIAKTKIAASGTAAFNYFATATVYHDFGSPAVSNFYLYDSDTGERNGEVLSSTSSNLGTYGELSVGMNFTKILQAGSALPARQLDTSVRLDSRFSDKLDSWGLTAQVRLQF